ncbi:hypothetical protein M408DRAFT_21156 [Serendipita vermifera MAFF 305830]|uniref:Aspartate/glutamate/uridylate kinase domain-containing protein n=1 Tax=Serendipita vermifera MAFF 305830 TaxID=933852 RepID=A0A0C3BIN1_SERVB|nr:hypothetical protein M408DRAFT_21156 [Serendipita vermifera MAFF 305830]
MGRLRTQKPLTVVIKLGTSSIIDETTHQPLLSILSSVVETCVKLRSSGHKVVLVSSGAIGVGMKRMNLPGKPKALSGRQALAAIGQGRLIALWDNLFGHVEQPIAQVLLTRGDISDRSRYLNAVNTFSELFNMGVIPIVNENDTVSVSEIRFGDNDTLSAITASMVHADYLFLLTDVEALYTSNPRKDPGAKAIDTVDSVTEIRKTVSTATLGSKLGTGGMETKLIAAEIATAAGVATVITSSKSPENVFKIIEYNVALAKSASMPGSASISASVSTPASALSITSEDTTSLTPAVPPVTDASMSLPLRPPHTLFKPSTAPLKDAKSWTAYTLAPAGSILIDSGAHRVLSRRDSGGRLLAVGVVDVLGTFASGQAVKIMVRKQIDGVKAAGGTSQSLFSSMKGKQGTVDGAVDSGAASPATPATPGLMATSLSALSVSSLDPFSRSASEGSLLTAGSGATEATPVAGTISLPVDDNQHNEAPSDSKATTVQFRGVVGPEEGWIDVEVGRGLANYNSVECSRIKGVKSSNIAQVLGYADSEYVVENITIHLTA